MSINSLNPVYDYFEKIGQDLSTGLTIKKISDRAKLISDPDIKNKVVFEVERHRGILGASYSEGFPLSSFVTYWPIYIFDPEKQEISEKEAIKKPEIHLDIYSVAEEQISDFSFSFEVINNSEYLCEESTYNYKYTIHNEQDIKKMITEFVENMNFDFYKDDLIDFFNHSRIEEILSELREACKEALMEKVISEWNNEKKI